MTREVQMRSRIEGLTGSQRRWLAQAVLTEPPPPILVAHLKSKVDDTKALLEWLRDRLPEHMLPRRVRIVDEVPRTAAGKIDRRALVRALTESGAGDVPGAQAADLEGEPLSEIEQILADIWKEVLDTDRIGVHDDFFELGGDSILSIRVISRAKKAGLVIDSPDFFATPTIAHIASVAKRTTDST